MGEKNISWTAGEIIYKVGDEPDFAYLLTKGEIEIISDKGTRVGFINEDEVFGELSILLNTKRTVTAITLKESKALLIQKKNLLNDKKNYEKKLSKMARAGFSYEIAKEALK